MSLIPCPQNCKYQKEGYCFLDTCAEIKEHENNCPYFTKRLSDKIDSLSNISDRNQFDIIRN